MRSTATCKIARTSAASRSPSAIASGPSARSVSAARQTHGSHTVAVLW